MVLQLPVAFIKPTRLMTVHCKKQRNARKRKSFINQFIEPSQSLPTV